MLAQCTHIQVFEMQMFYITLWDVHVHVGNTLRVESLLGLHQWMSCGVLLVAVMLCLGLCVWGLFTSKRNMPH